jgi:hypothetical protein
MAFAAPGETPEATLFHVRWVAYLMPAHNVFGRDEPAAAGAAEYVLSWRLPLAGPGLSPSRQLSGCFLYRVSHP